MESLANQYHTCAEQLHKNVILSGGTLLRLRCLGKHTVMDKDPVEGGQQRHRVRASNRARGLKPLVGICGV
jgi:hypothetical protein